VRFALFEAWPGLLEGVVLLGFLRQHYRLGPQLQLLQPQAIVACLACYNMTAHQSAHHLKAIVAPLSSSITWPPCCLLSCDKNIVRVSNVFFLAEVLEMFSSMQVLFEQL
jgi:hypothetical protein